VGDGCGVRVDVGVVASATAGAADRSVGEAPGESKSTRAIPITATAMKVVTPMTIHCDFVKRDFDLRFVAGRLTAAARKMSMSDRFGGATSADRVGDGSRGRFSHRWR
jgi:hypothetical protein